jgi:hypothetical protein
VREPSLLAVGRTAPQANVWLNGRELVVDSQGGFQGLVELIEGENVVRVEAIDRAGNKSVLVREVTYSSEPARATLPPTVRNVLVVAGVSIAGVLVLWVISGIWQRPLSLVLRITRWPIGAGSGGVRNLPASDSDGRGVGFIQSPCGYRVPPPTAGPG